MCFCANDEPFTAVLWYIQPHGDDFLPFRPSRGAKRPRLAIFLFRSASYHVSHTYCDLGN